MEYEINTQYQTLVFLRYRKNLFRKVKHSRFEWAGTHFLSDKHSYTLAALIVPASPGQAWAEPCRNCRDR